jgi:hypothetical protein
MAPIQSSILANPYNKIQDALTPFPDFGAGIRAGRLLLHWRRAAGFCP